MFGIGVVTFNGCVSSQAERDDGGIGGVTVSLVEELRSIEALLPMAPDSIVEVYRRYDRAAFHKNYASSINDVRLLIDSLNTFLPPEERIDTLSIDHTIENFGTAARARNSLYISSSYFFSFPDPFVLRSVVTHEFGHIHYDRLSGEHKAELDDIWEDMQGSALFYLFRDGEYSGNARFGGHPDESPAELFASAFNLFNNKEEELLARFKYIGPRHKALVERLHILVRVVSFVP
jgi:hypothetical protein